MAYIGLPPKANFTSGLLDRFTSTTGTTVTLTNDISSENDIVVFVNFVKQDSTTYSVGGTGNKTLTLGGTLVSSDIVEVHYLNIVGQTVNPSANSVGSSQLTADSITGQTAETSIADDDTIIIHDTSASSLKKMTKANFTSGIGGANTPLIQVSLQTAAQTITDSSQTKIAYNSVQQNVGGTWDSSNYRWTPGTAGKYFIAMSTMISADSDSDLGQAYSVVKMNGTIEFYFGTVNHNVQGYGRTHQTVGSVIKTMDDDDYIEGFAFLNTISGNNGRLDGELKQTWLTAYKIIT